MFRKNDDVIVEIPYCNNSIQLNFMLEESQDRHNRIICSFEFVHVQDIQVRYRKIRKIQEFQQAEFAKIHAFANFKSDF